MDNDGTAIARDSNVDADSSKKVDAGGNRSKEETAGSETQLAIRALIHQLQGALIPTAPELPLVRLQQTPEERLTVVEDILKDVVWAVGFILGFLLFVFILRR